MQIRADRHAHRPYGLFGGQAAAPSVNILHPDDGAELLPSKVTREIERGDVIRHEQAGGGGYGDPLERDPAAVLADIADEKISVDFARARFGVVLAANGQMTDVAATARLRAEMARNSTTVSYPSESAAQ
jgi:N-methylhydantoinase B